MSLLTEPVAVRRARPELRTPPGDPVRLTIVIPALNEEQAIGGTIERCLAARERIIAGSGVTGVDVVVVSDGSTDRTAEIARSYPQVQLIEFPRNRGYGAAIKAGWRRGGGDLLAFLDADGTCDPEYFTEMCRVALEDGADVVLGSRMGPGSRMPALRRVGNTLFAAMLGALSRRPVEDCASGMRVVRAASLPRLLPLPDGLSFTPSMSARALMDGRLVIREIPMAYAERIGRSKLSVIRDGIRFTREILSAAVYLKPSRITLPIAFVLAASALLLALFPAGFYLRHGWLPEWLIYRFLAILTLGSACVTMLCATVAAEHLIALGQLRYDEFLDRSSLWWGRRALRAYAVGGLAAGAMALAMVWPGIVSYLSAGTIPETTLHWSRMVVSVFLLTTVWQMAATACILRIIPALNDRQRFLVRGE